MGKHSHTLKALREIALTYSIGSQPDLPAMARELGAVIHRNGPMPVSALSRLRKPQPTGLTRWLLAERSKPGISILVMAWAPNHHTPVHDHGGLWGLELALHGALEVQSYARDPVTENLSATGRDWLGPGDASWFEGGQSHAHRCRNLSRHETALTLHVYGGNLAEYFTYERTGQADRWEARPQRAVIAGPRLA
ncbi:cysteine dioxygenase family protein [Dyella sp.]|uniref:cysteine dioxygenase n=1 Tax=Dyella sp. TaxID=1869338 RepID=UPI002ED437ED